MASISVQTGNLQTQGESFEQYGADLQTLLEEIDTKVQNIADNGIQGSASGKLLETYEGIQAAIKVYAMKIEALGTAIKASATAKANVDEAAATAASGSVS